MSYDLNFWKQERRLSLPPVEIYGKLCNGESVEGLAKLPVDQILKRLKEVFPSFDPTEDLSTVQTSAGSIEFSWSDQHFRFDIRGMCAECQKLVDVMREFGCPLYDPQENKRYDADGGTALGDSPNLAGGSSNKGCRSAAVFLLLIFAVLAVVIWRTLT